MDVFPYHGYIWVDISSLLLEGTTCVLSPSLHTLWFTPISSTRPDTHHPACLTLTYISQLLQKQNPSLAFLKEFIGRDSWNNRKLEDQDWNADMSREPREDQGPKVQLLVTGFCHRGCWALLPLVSTVGTIAHTGYRSILSSLLLSPDSILWAGRLTGWTQGLLSSALASRRKEVQMEPLPGVETKL